MLDTPHHDQLYEALFCRHYQSTPVTSKFLCTVVKAHKKGYFRETDNDTVMEKVDEAGQIIGVSILKVSALKGQPPLAVTLKK